MSFFSNFQFPCCVLAGISKRVLILVLAAALLQFSGCQETVVHSIEQPPVGTTSGVAESGLVGEFVEAAAIEASGDVAAYTAIGTQETVVVDQVQESVQDSALKKAGDLFERAKNTTGETASGATGWVQDKVGGAAEATSSAAQQAGNLMQQAKDATSETAKGAKGWVQDKVGAAADATSSAAQKAGDLLHQATDATGETAMGAKDWVQDKIGAASGASSAAAQDTLQWATDTFESLKSQGLTTASDTSEWLSQDWKNMESWEYTILSFSDVSDEQKTNELNSHGKNGWECYHVSDAGSAQKFYLKKRKESFLRHLPFKDFIKLVPLMQHANQ